MLNAQTLNSENKNARCKFLDATQPKVTVRVAALTELNQVLIHDRLTFFVLVL